MSIIVLSLDTIYILNKFIVVVWIVLTIMYILEGMSVLPMPISTRNLNEATQNTISRPCVFKIQAR